MFRNQERLRAVQEHIPKKMNYFRIGNDKSGKCKSSQKDCLLLVLFSTVEMTVKIKEHIIYKLLERKFKNEAWFQGLTRNAGSCQLQTESDEGVAWVILGLLKLRCSGDSKVSLNLKPILERKSEIRLEISFS